MHAESRDRGWFIVTAVLDNLGSRSPRPESPRRRVRKPRGRRAVGPASQKYKKRRCFFTGKRPKSPTSSNSCQGYRPIFCTNPLVGPAPGCIARVGGRLAPVVNGSRPELSRRVATDLPRSPAVLPRAERRPRPPGPIHCPDQVAAAHEIA